MNVFLKRVGKSLFTLFTTITLTFVIIRFMPGGPVQYLRARFYQQLGSGTSEAQINALVKAYVNVNPDKPLWRQYVDYLVSLSHGDLGKSILSGKPVADVLGPAIPWTVFLLGTSILLVFFVGIILGALMAYSEGGRFDFVASSLSSFLISVPFYVAGLLLIFLFAYQYPIFPDGGRRDPFTTAGWNLPFLLSVAHHAALPILSVVLTEFGAVALDMRGNSIKVLGSEYIRVAELRGLSTFRIATRYVAHNAILPIYTGLMISVGAMFGGSVILEQIFNYPGVGYEMVQAVGSRDYPVMMGAFLLISVAVIAGILFADLTYGKLDPRVGRGGDA